MGVDPRTSGAPLPRVERSELVVQAPGTGPGNWAGGPSAVVAEGRTFLAYRLRRPVGEGRGYANVVAVSEDGVSFKPLVEITKNQFESESLERPALVALPGGGWRLYVSYATPGTKHWQVVALDAEHPEGLATASARTVLPGDDGEAMKDPIVKWDGAAWHMWVCCHPLERSEDADRMWTRHAVSTDGLHWEVGDIALGPRAGSWDARGARVADVLMPDGEIDGETEIVAYYDGRARASQNAEEVTGLAVGTADRLTAVDDEPAAVAPEGTGSLRYLSVVAVPDGGRRLYYEATRRDGAHDLRTEYVPPTR